MILRFMDRHSNAIIFWWAIFCLYLLAYLNTPISELPLFNFLTDVYEKDRGELIAGLLTVFAGWLAFREAAKNNSMLRMEIHQQNLYKIVKATHSLSYVIHHMMFSFTRNNDGTRYEFTKLITEENFFYKAKEDFERFKKNCNEFMEKAQSEAIYIPDNDLKVFLQCIIQITNLLTVWATAIAKDDKLESTDYEHKFYCIFYQKNDPPSFNDKVNIFFQEEVFFNHNEIFMQLLDAYNESCDNNRNYKCVLDFLVNKVFNP